MAPRVFVEDGGRPAALYLRMLLLAAVEITCCCVQCRGDGATAAEARAQHLYEHGDDAPRSEDSHKELEGHLDAGSLEEGTRSDKNKDDSEHLLHGVEVMRNGCEQKVDRPEPEHRE